MKICIVDDDPTFRLLAGTLLRSLGHECDVANDGRQAWDRFRASQPDVVISDWMMPEMTGLDLCRSIRAFGPAEDTYFIMVTGRGSRSEMLEGMNAGADDYLIKPLNEDDLQGRLIAAARVTAQHRRLAERRTQIDDLNIELVALARRDHLTGLRNRRALDEDLAHLEARVARYRHRYSMALIDVDLFKSYNDAFGHPAGDTILRSVADELMSHTREGDAVYRYGGEEFLCIFPEQTLDGATLAVERMRGGLQGLAIPHTGNPLGVLTISAGMAVLDPDLIRSASQVLGEADKALYRAKRNGRNRVEQQGLQVA